ncbi:MAG: hypothetical protein PHU06_05990 [Gallionella sp.]|nr:hypothetical protein [Gallionella sp.]MDD4958410.1 hypothetical protein [Gallionella sp.]
MNIDLTVHPTLAEVPTGAVTVELDFNQSSMIPAYEAFLAHLKARGLTELEVLKVEHCVLTTVHVSRTFGVFRYVIAAQLSDGPAEVRLNHRSMYDLCPVTGAMAIEVHPLGVDVPAGFLALRLDRPEGEIIQTLKARGATAEDIELVLEIWPRLKTPGFAQAFIRLKDLG